MQRTLVLISILGLVLASLGVGTFAAHWPFWSRAMAWHVAGNGWPSGLRGPWRELRPATNPARFAIRNDPQLDVIALSTDAEVLLLSGADGEVRGFQAADFSRDALIDGRGLVPGLLALLIGVLQQDGRASLMDQPVGAYIEEWADDPRGAITTRQLLWQLSGLEGGRFPFLNPFDAQAQLASGPDFRRAALAVDLVYPPGSHFEPAAANAQVLAILASELAGQPWADVLEEKLWRRMAADAAQGLLDHRRGEMAAHCCFHATARDWLHVAQLLAGGQSQDPALLSPEFLQVLAVESPVNPGQGLGFSLRRDAAGRPLLVLATQGRLLAASPGSGRALFWAGSVPRDERREALLLGLL